eukprot:3096737-Pyramimonas_sp.AAC.1
MITHGGQWLDIACVSQIRAASETFKWSEHAVSDACHGDASASHPAAVSKDRCRSAASMVPHPIY